MQAFRNLWSSRFLWLIAGFVCWCSDKTARNSHCSLFCLHTLSHSISLFEDEKVALLPLIYPQPHPPATHHWPYLNTRWECNAVVRTSISFSTLKWLSILWWLLIRCSISWHWLNMNNKLAPHTRRTPYTLLKHTPSPPALTYCMKPSDSLPLHTNAASHTHRLTLSTRWSSKYTNMCVSELAPWLLYLLITQGQRHTHRHASSHMHACCQNCHSPRVCTWSFERPYRVW